MGIMEDYFAEKAPQEPVRESSMTAIDFHRCISFFNDVSKSWQVICSTPNDYGADFFYSVTLTYSTDNGSGIKVEKYGDGGDGLEIAIRAVLEELSEMGVEIPEGIING